jgi:hypothetical protein
MTERKTAHNIGFCAIRADEYRPSAFGILLKFCNLSVVNKKVTAKPADGILFPVFRKAPAVARDYIQALYFAGCLFSFPVFDFIIVHILVVLPARGLYIP